MTKEEFDAQSWRAGMKIKHTMTYRTGVTVTTHKIVSPNLFERLIGVDDGATEECEECGGNICVLTWLNCENCEIVTE